MKLLMATRNKGKVRELRQLLSGLDVELLSVDDAGDLPEVEEDGETFTANAIKKARTLAQASGLWALADDSGLEVDALGGAPGVHSARYAGEPCDFAANNRKLLKALEGVENRRARFRCVIALASPDGRVETVEGACEGEIAPALRGEGGFGYDPLFCPQGHAETFAEMPAERKHTLSHRGEALRKAVACWFDRQSGTQCPVS